MHRTLPEHCLSTSNVLAMTITQNMWISNALILMIILYYSFFLGWFIFVIFLHYGSIIARLYHSTEN